MKITYLALLALYLDGTLSSPLMNTLADITKRSVKCYVETNGARFRRCPHLNCDIIELHYKGDPVILDCIQEGDYVEGYVLKPRQPHEQC